MSDNSEIKALLMKGLAYSEVREITGAPAKKVADVAAGLREKGHIINAKTPEQVRASKIRCMPHGHIGDLLARLTDDELDFLMSMSLDSWADAAAVAVKELHYRSE